MLTFLVGPYGVRQEAARRHLAERLGEALGQRVEVEAVPSYGGLVEVFAKGRAHFAWLPPAVYVRCYREHDAQLLLCGVRARRAQFRGCLFVRADASLESVDELAGARVGWVDGLSCGGFLFPRLALRERGHDPDVYFSSQRFFEDHPSVVRAVDSGEIDVGATFLHLAAENEHAPFLGTGWELEVPRERMRALLVSEPIPADTLVAAPHVDRAVALRFTECVQGMHDSKEGRTLLRELFGVERFEPGLPSRYAAVERALGDRGPRGD